MVFKVNKNIRKVNTNSRIQKHQKKSIQIVEQSSKSIETSEKSIETSEQTLKSIEIAEQSSKSIKTSEQSSKSIKTSEKSIESQQKQRNSLQSQQKSQYKHRNSLQSQLKHQKSQQNFKVNRNITKVNRNSRMVSQYKHQNRILLVFFFSLLSILHIYLLLLIPLACPQVQAKQSMQRLLFINSHTHSYTCSLSWQSQNDLPSSLSMIKKREKVQQ